MLCTILSNWICASKIFESRGMQEESDIVCHTKGKTQKTTLDSIVHPTEIHVTYSSLQNNPDLLKKWSNKVKRERPLSTEDKVCELHFDEKVIIKYDEFSINGNTKRIMRERFKLKDGAIPTIFPNYPSYLNKTTKTRKSPVKRKLELNVSN